MNGQIGSLPRTVHREKAQTDGGQSEKMSVGVAHEFARQFGCGVRGDGAQLHMVFREGSDAGRPIHGTGRAKDQFLNSEFATEFENIRRPRDIDALVFEGPLDGWAHPGESRQMNHGVWPVAAEDGLQSSLIPNVGFFERESTDPPNFLEIRSLSRRGIELIQVVNHDQLIVARKQGFCQMRADESSAAGQ